MAANAFAGPHRLIKCEQLSAEKTIGRRQKEKIRGAIV